MKEIINPYGFIYITTNMVNGKRYIGQKMFRDGWKYYLGSGTALKRAIKKDGYKNFHRDIVAIAYSKEELDNLEIEWIQNYNAVKSDAFYNIADGGHGGNKFAGKTDEEIKVIMEKIAQKTRGRKVSIEERKRKSKSLKGKYVFANKTEEERREIYKKASLSKKGKVSWMKGKHHSKETRKKISESNKGEHNYFHGKTGKDSINGVKVFCVTTNKMFYTAKDASDYYHIKSPSCIIANCRKKRNSAGKLEDGTKLVWIYYDEYLKKIS